MIILTILGLKKPPKKQCLSLVFLHQEVTFHYISLQYSLVTDDLYYLCLQNPIRPLHLSGTEVILMCLAMQQRMAVLFLISVLTEALADLQEMLEVPEPLNSSPEGAAVQGPGRSAEVVTALQLWMSGYIKFHGERRGN